MWKLAWFAIMAMGVDGVNVSCSVKQDWITDKID